MKNIDSSTPERPKLIHKYGMNLISVIMVKKNKYIHRGQGAYPIVIFNGYIQWVHPMGIYCRACRLT